MKTLVTALLAGLLSLGGAGRALADEDERGHEHESVTLAELPAAAQQTFKREAKGGKVEQLRKETRKGGAVVYEAEIVREGRGAEIEVGADGKILERGTPHDERAEHDGNK